MPTYDWHAKVEIKAFDVEFRRAAKRQLMARVYQPQGAGPYPVLLDLHGGAWNNKDRFANVPMCEAVARSGVLVVSIDMTRAPEEPYPVSVKEANYGVRWLKLRAKEWNGDVKGYKFGILGSSSGGHMAELVGMQPDHPVYSSYPLEGGAGIDARVDYIATRSPISDPYSRHLQALKRRRANMINNSKTWFVPWEAIHEANPQEILLRGEPASLPPLLIMQGGLDDNVIASIQTRFAETYREAGGRCTLEIFQGCDHEWIAEPGPDTDRAHKVLKAFIAKQLNG